MAYLDFFIPRKIPQNYIKIVEGLDMGVDMETHYNDSKRLNNNYSSGNIKHVFNLFSAWVILTRFRKWNKFNIKIKTIIEELGQDIKSKHRYIRCVLGEHLAN